MKIENDMLSVLNQFGNVVKMKSQQILKKLDPKRAMTTDTGGRTVATGDMILVTDPSFGSARRGTVVYIHRAFVFVQSREVMENGGIMVAKSANVSLLTGNRPVCVFFVCYTACV